MSDGIDGLGAGAVGPSAAGAAVSMAAQTRANESLRQETTETLRIILKNISTMAWTSIRGEIGPTAYADLMVNVRIDDNREEFTRNLKIVLEKELTDFRFKTPGNIFLRQVLRKHPRIIDDLLAEDFYNGIKSGKPNAAAARISHKIHEILKRTHPDEYSQLVRSIYKKFKKIESAAATKIKLATGTDKQLALGLKAYLETFMLKIYKDQSFINKVENLLVWANKPGLSKTERTVIFKSGLAYKEMKQALYDILKLSKPCASRNFLLAVFEKLPDYADKFVSEIFQSLSANLLADRVGSWFGFKNNFAIRLHNDLATNESAAYKEICGTSRIIRRRTAEKLQEARQAFSQKNGAKTGSGKESRKARRRRIRAEQRAAEAGKKKMPRSNGGAKGVEGADGKFGEGEKFFRVEGKARKPRIPEVPKLPKI